MACQRVHGNDGTKDRSKQFNRKSTLHNAESFQKFLLVQNFRTDFFWHLRLFGKVPERKYLLHQFAFKLDYKSTNRTFIMYSNKKMELLSFTGPETVSI